MKNRKEQNSSLTNLHKFFPAKPCTYSPTPPADPISSAQQSAPSYASPAPTVPYAPSHPRSAARTQSTGANSPGSAVKFIIYGVISSSFNSLIRSNPVSAVIKARLFSIADAAIIASGSLTLLLRPLNHNTNFSTHTAECTLGFCGQTVSSLFQDISIRNL